MKYILLLFIFLTSCSGNASKTPCPDATPMRIVEMSDGTYIIEYYHGVLFGWKEGFAVFYRLETAQELIKSIHDDECHPLTRKGVVE